MCAARPRIPDQTSAPRTSRPSVRFRMEQGVQLRIHHPPWSKVARRCDLPNLVGFHVILTRKDSTLADFGPPRLKVLSHSVVRVPGV